jgi:hypothetical protein
LHHFLGYIEKDYYTVFPDRNPKKNAVATTTGSKENDDSCSDEEKVYEIGADGTIDVS